MSRIDVNSGIPFGHSESYRGVVHGQWPNDFAQLMDLLPLAEFCRCVDRYDGDYKVQSFSCLDQFLSPAFAQLASRESLRDIETCLRTHAPTLSHGLSGRHLAQQSRQR